MCVCVSVCVCVCVYVCVCLIHSYYSTAMGRRSFGDKYDDRNT